MKKILYIILGLLLVTFYSCQEEVEVDPGKTAVVELAGQWWLRLYDASDMTVVYDEWLEAYTFNTASDRSDSLWVEVHDYTMRIKTHCDIKNKTFDAPTAYDIINEVDCSIMNGKIIKKGAITMGGHVVDSIYFEYSDASGDYIFAGQRFTGFAEDDPFTPEQ